jgi:hypothetical protein
MQPDTTSLQLRVAVFPSAADVHLYHAIDGGGFARHGLEVDLHEVTSSDEQMSLWDSGAIDVMHTAVDHLLRGRSGAPVAVRAEGVGELEVYVRPDVEPAEARWAVDGVESAFSFVLRAVVEHHTGQAVPVDQLVAVGGTKQRFEALVAGSIDGTTLHPPFGAMAAAAGLRRVGGHLDVVPDLLGVAAIARREALGGPALSAYLAAIDESAAEIVAGGEEFFVGALVRRGFPAEGARAVAGGMLGPLGPLRGGPVTRSNLRVSAELRDRFVPGGHAAALDLDTFLVAPEDPDGQDAP